MCSNYDVVSIVTIKITDNKVWNTSPNLRRVGASSCISGWCTKQELRRLMHHHHVMNIWIIEYTYSITNMDESKSQDRWRYLSIYYVYLHLIICIIGSSLTTIYNYVYLMHFDGSNMRNRIFVTFIHICTSNMRILTFSVFVPTYTYKDVYNILVQLASLADMGVSLPRDK